MKYTREYFKAGDQVIVSVDKQCNVHLFDDSNFSVYKAGRSATGYGGWAVKSPITLVVPSTGFWNIVVDMGATVGSVNFSVHTIKQP